MNRIKELELKLVAAENLTAVVKKEIEELKNKPKFEVGKWYKNGCFLGCITSCSNEDFKFYGFNAGGAWRDDDYYSFEDYSLVDKYTREATNEEVQTALIKEFNKKYEDKHIAIGSSKAHHDSFHTISYCKERNSLYVSNGCFGCDVMINGVWLATVIDTPLTINSYEMKQDGDMISFGCAKFHKQQFMDMDTLTRKYASVCDAGIVDSTRTVKAFTLSSDVTITVKELQEIVNKME